MQMDKYVPYATTQLTPNQLEVLRSGLAKAAEFMTAEQLADLADTLHELRRAKRSNCPYRRCEVRT